MAGVTPSRLLDAMLSRAVASRTENFWSPSRPGGIVGLPLSIWPSVAAAPPSDAAAATPALAPMNWRRLSFLLIPRFPPPASWGRLVDRNRRDLVVAAAVCRSVEWLTRGD